MKLRKKSKYYYKINTIIYSLFFIWVFYLSFTGPSYYWILTVLMGLVVVYWVWKEWKGK